MDRSVASNIDALYINVYSSLPNSKGRLMEEDADIADMVTRAHNAGLEVWATYGYLDWTTFGCDPLGFPLQRMQEVIDYNADNPAAPLDGVILDIITGIPLEDFQAMLAMYECIRDLLHAAGIKLGVAIRFAWEAVVEYPAGSGNNKPVYQHVIDLGLDQVVVLAYRDFAGDPCPTSTPGIVCLAQDEVQYASAQGLDGLVLVGVETFDCAPGCGPEYVTFAEEGQSTLNAELDLVRQAFHDEAGFGGFSVHFYRNEYLKGTADWPTTNPDFPDVK